MIRNALTAGQELITFALTAALIFGAVVLIVPKLGGFYG